MNQMIFITGADRGLGLALTKDFLDRGDIVFAGQFMEDWNELAELKLLHQEHLFLIPLDVSDPESVIDRKSVV